LISTFLEFGRKFSCGSVKLGTPKMEEVQFDGMADNCDGIALKFRLCDSNGILDSLFLAEEIAFRALAR
jgi:hypothetical protein